MSRIALLLGLGALSTAGAQADTAPALRPGAELLPGTGSTGLGDILISSDSGRLYVVEPGNAAEELHLGNTPEAQRLRQLLHQHGSDARNVQLNRMILAGGGGKGISWGHWKPVRSERPSNPRNTGSSARTATPDTANSPQHNGAIGSGNYPVTENKK